MIARYLYADRRAAGRALAERLLGLGLDRPVVLAMPRGGVPVGLEVAAALGAALDVVVVRKVSVPQHPEYGIGSVTEDGEVLLDQQALRSLGLVPSDLEREVARERETILERLDRYRRGRPPVDLAGRDVVIVDDGLATGISARAALGTVHGRRPRRVVLATPVGAIESVEALAADVEVVCLATPADFHAVGAFYGDFRQVSDDEVVDLLRQST